jgi:L,D-transpeptidase YcbB
MPLTKLMTAGAAALIALSGCGEAGLPPAAPKTRPAAAGQETASAPAPPVVVDPGIAAFYAARGHRPLWVADVELRPEAETLVRILGEAGSHGLDPQRYGGRDLAAAAAAARGGDKRALARAELLLSRGFTAFVRDLRVPAASRGMNYVDAGLAPEPPSPRALLEEAAAAPSLAAHLESATRMNPLYESLRRGYLRWQAGAPKRSASDERRIRANLDRARAIPAQAGRYIIVDAASARLWMIEGDRVEGPMRVIAGKPHMQTPAMAGLVRYAVLNPYWNLPPDLARERARRVLRQGTGILSRERLEILSDWGDSPQVLAPSQVDWRAVASGRRSLRMRQLPGGANVMGAIKFMMPNDLGIYLHDFPDKSLFARTDRHVSSGCVRLEDAPRLARWLFAGAPPRPDGPSPEQRVDLPEPVPVYITYLTALPDRGSGIALQPDDYRRDRMAAVRRSAGAARAGS